MNLLRQDRFRRLTAIFLLAFLIKALVPDGFMPVFSSGGKIEITICTSQGPVKQLVDFDPAFHRALGQTQDGDHSHSHSGVSGHGGEHGGDGGAADHPLCPYAPVTAQNTAYPPPYPAAFFIPHVPVVSGTHAFLPYGTVEKPWRGQAPPHYS